MLAPRRIHPGVLFIGAAFAVWAVLFIFRSSFVAADGRRYFSLFDDAMISMRYAWNASHGLGLVWNPGERVEGYTNLLMVGLMAIWTRFLDKTTAVLGVQLSGILLLLGIAYLAMLHWLELAKGGDVRHRDGFAAIVFLGSLGYYPLAYWTLMGMETGLLALLLLAGSLLVLITLRTGKASTLGGAVVLLGLAYLTRPDSAPLAVLLLAASALPRDGTKKPHFSSAALALLLYLLFPIAQIVFRAAYYGTLLPLTYALKATGMPFPVRLENGIGFTLPFLWQARWAFVLGVLGVVAGFNQRKALLMIPPIVLVGYQIVIGGDGWNYWRLVSPGVPYLILLSLAGADWVVGEQWPFFSRAGRRMKAYLSRIPLPNLARASRAVTLRNVVLGAAMGMVLGGLTAGFVRPGSAGFGIAQRSLVFGGALLGFAATLLQERPVRHMAAFAVTTLVLASLNLSFLKEAVLSQPPFQAEDNETHVNEALAISLLTTEDASVGVLWAGVIPYYTSRYAVDFLGKNDPHIANLSPDLSGAVAWSGMYSVPGHNKYDLEYSILERRPTYVEGFQWGIQDLSYLLGDLYVEVSMPGARLALLRGDPRVRWDRIPEDLISP